ncbi:uncharacterized protein [Medicago truncatula]|uniref:CAAX amino terminal protease family protein n=1 Tax=Medicago truncatula TaxID=3880 RepID=A0A072UTN8_MEDTR|nr:uncharacterized protein LOC11443754 isoform X3 [Medicago truncatula]KEH32418.1 CAAX amino terminal protease family protein [Medicago truncatula]
MAVTTLTTSFLPAKPFPSRQFRLYKRRRLKIKASFPVPPPSPFENLFNTLISQCSSVNSIDFIAPSLGFASGSALFFSRFKSSQNSDVGEWILFASPTPFNRFVLLRCPSISFKDNERLIKDEKHYGRIRVNKREKDLEEELKYQRVCLSASDGGVVSLDWPVELDLEEERGLDSTLLIVPGTPQGSMDDNIRVFVIDALKRGFFPVVMNPRGCASSPITTPRLFTAADSDDICTAITYINKARPWTTLMGVGWGYGANMLTKYLAEVGERTPLTAATCIDNPFDLDEATRTFPYHHVTDQKLTRGLINILQTNKALFQGKAKGFDVGKALLAKSVRDFEEAISMVSYGFVDIEDFYTKASTRNMIKDIKIPVLFIQWLAAVELGLLKGRHPLLTDIDLTIIPSKGLTLVEDARTDKNPKVGKLLELARSDAYNGYSIDPSEDLLEGSKNDAGLHFGPQQDVQQNFEQGDMSLQVKDGPLQQTSSSGRALVGEEDAASVDSEHGHVMQTAQVVTNMLDVTMPGTLTEEQKKKVLAAVGRGETLMNALEDAVPEDVRGKLKDAVAGILQARGSDLKFDRILNTAQSPNSSPGQKNQEKSPGASSAEVSENQSSSNQMKNTSSSIDGSDNVPSGMSEPAEGTKTEVIRVDEHSTSSAQSQESNNGVGSSRKETGESRDNSDTNEDLKGKIVLDMDHSKKELETGSKSYTPDRPDGAGGSEAEAVAEHKSQKGGIAKTDEEETDIPKVDQKSEDFSSDQSKTASTDAKEEPTSPISSENQTVEREGNVDENKDDKNMQQVSPQTNSSNSDSAAPGISVSQAFEALTGMDDSTQIAVNSVFGVIENMLSQLEKSSDNEDEVKDGKSVEHKLEEQQKSNTQSNDSNTSGKLEEQQKSNTQSNDSNTSGKLEEQQKSNEAEVKDEQTVEHKLEEQQKGQSNDSNTSGKLEEQQKSNEAKVKDEKTVEHKLEEQQKGNSQSNDPNTSGNPSLDDHHDGISLRNDSCDTEEQLKSLSTINGSSVCDSQNYNSDDHPVKKPSNTNSQLIVERSLDDEWDGHRQVSSMPEFIVAGSYGHGNSPYKKYLHKHLVSEIPTKSLDLDTTTALFLDYFPQGQWKLYEQPQKMESSSADTEIYKEVGSKMKDRASAKSFDEEECIEPPYVILDTEKQQGPVKEFNTTDTENRMIHTDDDRSEKSIQFVKNKVLDSLKMEVGRKLNAAEVIEMKPKLTEDLEHVANAVSLAVVTSKGQQLLYFESQGRDFEGAVGKFGSLDGEYIIRAISSSVQQTSCLRKVIPVGVIVGSILASLRKYFNIAPRQENGHGKSLALGDGRKPGEKNYVIVDATEADQVPDEKTSFDHPIKSEFVESELEDSSKNTVMVGAVTAAIGASALLMQQQDSQGGNVNHKNQPEGLEEEVSDNQNNIITSLAEKAMSVAGPVVPTKEDGGVDQDRLVAMLADLGQRGGLLRLVGKFALLWGGIRGAMSLTDKLISFFHFSERPLFQRIFGFAGMILVLWSPVAIPLLPTIVQGWTTNTPSKIAEAACIIGLYIAIMILVMIWGKRIRGYENAFEQYGLDLTSKRLIEFLKSLIGGVMFIFSIHVVNAFLGCASFSWPHIPPSLDVMAWLKLCGQMGLLIVQGTVMASAISFVEELLFRSWLPQEIEADLGYHRGIIISGLAFSFLQRSLQSIPGLLLLSLSLSGARQRNGGSLSIPIGLRAGMLASTFILQKGGFLTYNYKGNIPLWMIGSHPFQPFSGLVGLVFSLSLAIILYPRPTSQKIESKE